MRAMVFLLSLLVATGTFAAGGTLAPSFATSGIRTEPPACCGPARGAAVAVQADGKVVVAGLASDGTRNQAVVARFTPNGAPDTTFATSGLRRLAIANNDADARAVAIQADGRIVVAGWYLDDQGRMQGFVARITASGQLDATHGSGGIVRLTNLPAGTVGSKPRALILQPDGKAVIAGSLTVGASSTEAFVARLDTTGAMDASFGNAGFARSGLADSVLHGLVRAADGALVAAGQQLVSPGAFPLVMRLLEGGVPDNSFDGDGARVIGTSGSARAVALQADGRIVVAGRLGSNGAVLRLLPDGTLDTSYNGTGATSAFPGGPSGVANVVLVGADGGHYALLTEGAPTGGARIVKITSAGALDPAWPTNVTFEGEGEGSPPLDREADMAVSGGGIVVAAGTAGLDGIVLHRLVPNNMFDTTFGGGGRVDLRPGLRIDRGAYPAIAVGADGKIIAARREACPSNPNGPACARVVRLLPNGSPDPALTTADAGGLTSGVLGAGADGKFFMASVINDQGTGAYTIWRLYRLNVDGTLDTAFTPTQSLGGGYFFNPPLNYFPGKAIPYADGRVLFVTDSGSMVRLLPNGQRDPAFNFGSAVGGEGDVAILPSGAIISARSSLRKYTADGLVDTNFGNSGSVSLPVPVGRVALQPDGKIVVAGRTGPPGVVPTTPFISRYNADGTVDTSFGSGGTVQLGNVTAGSSISLAGIAILPSGRIVIAGTDGAGGTYRPFVARLDANGVPDAAFGPGGTAFIAPSGYDTALAMALLPDANIALGGSAFGSPQLPGQYAVMKVLSGEILVGPGSPPVGGVGVPYSVTLGALGGTPPYTLSIGGALPSGLSFSNGVLSGTPTTAGTSSLTFNASDSAGNTGSQAVILTIFSPASLVRSYYQTILDRSPDAGGQQFWQDEAARVSALGASISEVFYAMAGAFFTSPEYLARNATDTQFVTDLYQTFFNRDPDSGGLTYWTGEIAAGKTRGAVMNDFLFSAEFAYFMGSVFGPAATSRAEVSMVMDFYRGVLGRLPDSGGFTYWLSRFRAAQCDGTVVAAADAISGLFFASGEYAQRQGAVAPLGRNAAFVGDLYNAVLRRGGDREGIQYWVNQIDTGARSREQVREAFVRSPEFQGRVQAVLAQGCLRN